MAQSRSFAVGDPFQVDDRVCVQSVRPCGTVRYIGETKFAPGEWLGIELDEPVGKNDGSIAGDTYFTCEPSFGVFARRAACAPELERGRRKSRGYQANTVPASPGSASPVSPSGCESSAIMAEAGRKDSDMTAEIETATHQDMLATLHSCTDEVLKLEQTVLHLSGAISGTLAAPRPSAKLLNDPAASDELNQALQESTARLASKLDDQLGPSLRDRIAADLKAYMSGEKKL